MSADSHTVCPKCYPEIIGWKSSQLPGNPATDHAAEELGLDRDVRENIDYYITGGNELVFEYVAKCWTCGWHWEHTHRALIPGLETPT